MPCNAYKKIRLTSVKRDIIAKANRIIAEYARNDLDLTLRQVYYQFVSRNWFPEDWTDPATGSKNNDKSYKRLGGIIGDARMAGYIDWDSITDRTRNLRKRPEWGKPLDLIDVCAKTYRIDRWLNQPRRPEVWIEKDALVGLCQQPCEDNGVAYFSCRGYTSMSEIWVAAQRIGTYIRAGQKVTIFHLGDHDPSGVDMSRDIEDRLREMVYTDLVRAKWLTKASAKEMDDRVGGGEDAASVYPFWVSRIALTMDQVQEYGPPPNPAKMTDARARKYVDKFGDESWELDALDPLVIVDLIETAIGSVRDEDKWAESEVSEYVGIRMFEHMRDRYAEVEKLLTSPKKKKGK